MNMNCDNNAAPSTSSPTTGSDRLPRPTNLSNGEPDTDTRLESSKVQSTTISDISLNPSDVLCGRGKLSFNHVGNRRFRDLISASVAKYNEAESRLEKAKIVNGIVDDIQAAGGRFLRQDEKEETWHALNHTQCREKVGHAVRDATSSIEARKKRKRMQAAARKNVINTILSKPEATPMHMGSFGLPTMNYENDILGTMGYKNNRTFSSTNEDASKLFVTGDRDLLDAPSDFYLSAVQQQNLISSLRPRRTEHTQDVFSSSIWTPHAAAFHGPPQKRLTGIAEDGDDQFLAFIDEVLGPIHSSGTEV